MHVILLLHSRYRHAGGEERAVEDLQWLISTQLGEEAAVLERSSARLGRGRAALGLLAGGLEPRAVAAAVERTGARVVHAHNTTPTLGWRALAAARAAGARVVLHLHNYRLVCAIGTCFTQGEDCTRCHGRNTLPGLARNCRGARAEGAAYAAGLALWQRRLAASADALIVPSAFALERLRELGAPLGDRAVVLGSVQRSIAARSRAADGEYVLAAGRLTPEKGFEDAVRACAAARLPLVVAGDGPELERLRTLATELAAAAPDRAVPGGAAPDDAAPDGPGRAVPLVRFVGRVDAAELARLRERAAVAVVPSRYAEILPLAALEAMAAGLPVVAARAGGLAEAVPAAGLYPAGDVAALADHLRALFGNAAAGEQALAHARASYAPPVIAARLAEIYAG